MIHRTMEAAMAWKRTDDLDGSEAQQETFGLFGKAYAIDLGEASRAKIEAALRPFLAVATPYGQLPEPPFEASIPTPATTVSTPVPAPTPARRAPKPRRQRKLAAGATPHRTIRAWANDNGYSVGPQGRIPKRVMDAFEAQQPA